MSKVKNPRYTTPAGIAQYPYLTKPDTKFNPDGEYKISVEIPGAAAQDIVTFLDEQFAASVAKAKKENPGKKIKEGDVPYSVNDDTGKVTVRFKLKAKVTPKQGDPFEQRPALFDAKGKPIGPDAKIGGGSKVKVAYELVPYYTAIAGAGVSLRLKAVQVIDLVEFSGGASSEAYGFGEEEGYEAEDTPAAQNGFAEETSDTDF
ncbi:single-stranded DNA-binding protein [uncultured Caudovirales phage]|uniref:Single-stranded DNA-binding protein n=1 Tax=uncultured Caudovirales phage TaxID=2100421 RepID=A0A6J5LW76_9CAUD|nr:single-stranded DNA-binding protein [uncultured Caudovirales phage]